MMAFQATICGIKRTAPMKPVLSRMTPNTTAGMVPRRMSIANLPQGFALPRRRSMVPVNRHTQSRQK